MLSAEACAAHGRYFDGQSARPLPVSLRLAEGRLEVLGPDLRRDWSSLDLRADDSARPLMRVGPAGSQERVELTDNVLAAALERLCPNLHADLACERRSVKAMFWSMATAAVLGLMVFGMPLGADFLAPLIPAAVEERIGTTVQDEIGHLLGNSPVCAAPAGQAALVRLAHGLGAGLLPGFRVSVRQSSQANAFAIPGARVVVLSRVIDQARTPDEFAGVLAHELGHVAARDPLRNLIRTSGTSYLLSYLVGDLIGSAVIVAVGEAALSASYSREAEAAADAYSVAALARAGGNGAALADILERIAVDQGEGLAFLRSHPFTRERAAAIRALAAAAPQPLEGRRPILDAPSWEALKAICAAPASR